VGFECVALQRKTNNHFWGQLMFSYDLDLFLICNKSYSTATIIALINGSCAPAPLQGICENNL
jgi:hypothetical protein